MERKITIEGMGCDHCIVSVREALEGIEGVTVNDVEIGRARVTVSEGVDADAIDEAIHSAGYEPTGQEEA
ncbi:MAG: cation transporter [Rhodothermales bacterium]